MHANSILIAIEGSDGAGKTQLATLLGMKLPDIGFAASEDIMVTHEPHNASFGGEFIRAALRKQIIVSPQTLALAYAANRADHLDRWVKPFMEGGTKRVVITDRYYLSSLAYQTSDELPMETVMGYSAMALKPDLTLFLDANVETCKSRISTRGWTAELFDDKFEKLQTRYFEAINYLRGRDEVIYVIDANRPIEEILESALEFMKRWLEGKLVTLPRPSARHGWHCVSSTPK